MSKNINIDVDKLTFWQAVKLNFAVRNDQKLIVKHEDTGMGWIAIAIVIAALIMKGLIQ